jgi:hypothetical protein
MHCPLAEMTDLLATQIKTLAAAGHGAREIADALGVEELAVKAALAATLGGDEAAEFVEIVKSVARADHLPVGAGT